MMTVKTTNWNEVLNKPGMPRATVNFGLGIISSDNFYTEAIHAECGKHVRNLIRTNGATKSREIVRKMLRRRNLLNRFNLVDPKYYSQL